MGSPRSLVIVGTSHVSRESVKKVIELIKQEKPDVLAVELCPTRLALLSNVKGLSWRPRATGLIEFLANLLELAYGFREGVFPGEEMAVAVAEASKQGIPVCPVDLDIREIMSRVNRVSMLERLKFMFFAVMAMLASPSMGEVKGDSLLKLISEFKREFPSMYKVLIEERNNRMVNAVKNLFNAGYRKVMLITGLGHIPGLLEFLRKLSLNFKVKVVRTI